MLEKVINPSHLQKFFITQQVGLQLTATVSNPINQGRSNPEILLSQFGYCNQKHKRVVNTYTNSGIYGLFETSAPMAVLNSTENFFRPLYSSTTIQCMWSSVFRKFGARKSRSGIVVENHGALAQKPIECTPLDLEP